MNSPLVRPRVANVQFHVYDRALHPELFESLASRTWQFERMTLTVRIILSGHWLEWRSNGSILTELTCLADAGLPELGRCLKQRFDGERRSRMLVHERYEYQSCLSAEVLPAERFVHVHEELVQDGYKRGLLFHLKPNHRLGLTPLGFVDITLVPKGLSVTAFHTFPEELAIIKTQSLIESCWQ